MASGGCTCYLSTIYRAGKLINAINARLILIAAMEIANVNEPSQEAKRNQKKSNEILRFYCKRKIPER